MEGRDKYTERSAMRGIKANAHIGREIQDLVDLIQQAGGSISFGRLFELYVPISNKVVGLLIRARRHDLLDFPGEILYQGRDDQVMIYLKAKSLASLPELHR
eukprot:TRINITY_DN1482_c0_g1_i3.p3 TRINITY_DN1482_c0_g1~~TRINITY_DN1482_c0_g1_i3.p3  ORF type:complete len:102 (+),score=27.09 TRINITY_DN1482_c0_g1_i3:69-374(+)